MKGRDKKIIKCLVWDLDNTMWDGILLEDEKVTLKEDTLGVIQTLDSRGILQSIASRNDYDAAMKKLQEFKLQDYFLYPQVSWNSKVTAIQSIARLLNIGLDSLAFIDDQPFEREEVNFSLPEIRCIDAGELDRVLAMPEMNPPVITEDSKIRRQMYVSDMDYKRAEEEFVGPKEEFLATLDMRFTISLAKEKDLRRAEELTMRTNQLNTTGYTYSFDELARYRKSEGHRLLIAGLEDRYGRYGKIGLSLIECREDVWTIKLLLMSCRVMSRGVGSILLNHIMKLAKDENVRLLAEFVSNQKNRMMYITYKFAGFKEIDSIGDMSILANDLTRIQKYPDYVKIRFEGRTDGR